MEKKRTVWQWVVCIGLVCLIWGGYFFAKEYYFDRILNIKEDNFTWVHQVDTIEVKQDKIVLYGFAFHLKKDAEFRNFEIILQDTLSGERYYGKMKYMERSDVNEYFLCEYDYLKSGYEVIFSQSQLDLQERNYEILLRVKGSRTAYLTETYLTKGKLVYTEPTDFKPLDVAGTDLEKVVGEGFLRVYCPDFGVYVYQLDKELYWITEEWYDFSIEGKSSIQYQLYTTQRERLPQERLDNKWYWDNISFRFEEKEIKDWNTGKYRVAMETLPNAYSITKVDTGRYKSEQGWIWKESFRPIYFFE